MIIPPGILTLEKVYDLADDPRYLDPDHPGRDPYADLVDRLFRGHLAPEDWPAPPSYTLGRPVAPAASVGVGGENRPEDVAEVTEGLRAVNGLDLGGWLRPSGVPTPEFNAAVLGFQRAQGLMPDGLMLPDGPTLRALNRQFPLPANTEAGALNPAAGGPVSAIVAGGLTEAQGADAGSDPFAEGRGRYPRAIVDNVDRLLAPEPPEFSADTVDGFEEQTRENLNREALAGFDPNSLMTKLGYRPNEQAVFGPMGVPGDVFRDEIGRRESSNNWKAERTEPVALGRYQLRIIALKDVKLMDAEGNWTGRWGIRSKSQFLADSDVQNLAMTEFMRNNERYLHGARDELDVFDFRGQEIVGISGSFGVTPVGLMAAAHRWGAGGVRSYIDHQIENGWVSDFEGLDKDTRDKFQAIETRLREFRKVAYND